MKKQIKNTKSGRLAAFIFFVVVLMFQVYMYPRLLEQYDFFKDHKVANATVREISKVNITVSFRDGARREVMKEKQIGNYNPFTKIKVGQKVVVKYLPEKSNTFLVEGYDEEPVLFLLIFIFLAPLIGQIVFLRVLFNLKNEDDIDFLKR